MTTTDTRLSTFGARDEIKELGFRLQKMMPSAQSFTADEALAVAQIAHAHALDPFNGEVWGIKRQDTGQWYGVMVGIKGLRKCAHRAAAEENSSYWLDFVPTEAKKYHVTQEGAIVYECHLRDAANMQAYGQAVHNLTDSGIPYEKAIEMVGPAPVVVGIGVAWPAERSKMGLHQRAKKRAEADALKTRYDVDFGSGVKFTVEAQEDIIDVGAQDIPEVTPDAFDQGVEGDFPKQTEEQNLSDLGFGDAPSKTVQHPDQTKNVDVLSPDVVNAVVNEGLFSKVPEATSVLSRFVPKKAPVGVHIKKARLYREWKNELLAAHDVEDGPAITDQAIAHANAGDEL